MDRKNIKKALSLIREGYIDKAEKISKTLTENAKAVEMPYFFDDGK